MSNDPRNDPWEMLRIETDTNMRRGFGSFGGCGSCLAWAGGMLLAPIITGAVIAT
ncbi:MAG: hypothetical protein LC118_15495 [Dehalococcoidia bacterium]|nr:hypothetical protein [Dehalococcoidia bacterium]